MKKSYFQTEDISRQIRARTRNPEMPLPDAFDSEASIAPSTQTRLVHSVRAMKPISLTDIRTEITASV